MLGTNIDGIFGRYGNAPQMGGQWEQLVKAITTSGASNTLDSKAALKDVQAMRLESLDSALRAIVPRRKDLVLFPALAKKKVGSSVYEWATKTSNGGDVGYSYLSEGGQLRRNRTKVDRNIVKIKYLAEAAEVTLQAMMQDTLVNLESMENESATVRLLQSFEHGIIESRTALDETRPDGLQARLEAELPSHMIDLDGSSDTDKLYNLVYEAMARGRGPEGGFGQVSDMLLSPLVQKDLDLYLQPQWRVDIGGTGESRKYGAPVKGITTSYGDVKLKNSIWLEEGDFDNLTAPAIIRNAGTFQDNVPAAPISIVPLAQTSITGSKFTGTRNGTYWYAASSSNENGEGPLTAITTTTVAVGGAMQLTITPNATGSQTWLNVYRSMQNPAVTPTAAELRLVARIPATGTGAVVYQDKNTTLPGASKGALLDMTPEAIDIVELSKLTKFNIPVATLAKAWAVFYFAAPRFGILKRHWMFKNYVAKSSRWKPHT